MRILLILLLPIGDTLFATPAIHALRKHYPDARITALVYPTNRGILHTNRDIDDFLVWPTRQEWKGISGVLRLFWRIRQAHFDLAVEFSNYAWWVTRIGSIPRRAEMNLPHLWWLLPWAGNKWREKHAVEHYSDVVRRLGVPVEDMRLRLRPSVGEATQAQAWLHRFRVHEGELLIGLHPGGEGLWGRKRWPVERFAKVIDGLYDALGARILIMGGKDEAHLGAELAARTHAHVINATGQTTLGETAALVRHCTLFIGNDSSPLHIAAASGVPVVGIYGPTDPRSYHPWVPGPVLTGRNQEGNNRQRAVYAVVRSSLPCACRFSLVGGITLAGWARSLMCPSLEAITPQQVLDAALSLIAHTDHLSQEGPA